VRHDAVRPVVQQEAYELSSQVDRPFGKGSGRLENRYQLVQEERPVKEIGADPQQPPDLERRLRLVTAPPLSSYLLVVERRSSAAEKPSR